MTLTLKDIKDRLSIMDEITVLELLGLTSEQIVDRFEDILEEKADIIEQELQEDPLFFEEGDTEGLFGEVREEEGYD